MKRIDGWDICINWIILPISIIAAIMMIISFIGLQCQKESFVDQNDYCVVLNKDSRLTPQVIGKIVTARRVNRVNIVGLTTQDTVTVNVSRCIFDDIEIGDTIKPINLK
jgi:hypothetical protein